MSSRTTGQRTRSRRKAKRLGISPLSRCELPPEDREALISAAEDYLAVMAPAAPEGEEGTP